MTILAEPEGSIGGPPGRTNLSQLFLPRRGGDKSVCRSKLLAIEALIGPRDRPRVTWPTLSAWSLTSPTLLARSTQHTGILSQMLKAINYAYSFASVFVSSPERSDILCSTAEVGQDFSGGCRSMTDHLAS